MAQLQQREEIGNIVVTRNSTHNKQPTDVNPSKVWMGVTHKKNEPIVFFLHQAPNSHSFFFAFFTLPICSPWSPILFPRNQIIQNDESRFRRPTASHSPRLPGRRDNGLADPPPRRRRLLRSPSPPSYVAAKP